MILEWRCTWVDVWETSWHTRIPSTVDNWTYSIVVLYNVLSKQHVYKYDMDAVNTWRRMYTAGGQFEGNAMVLTIC